MQNLSQEGLERYAKAFVNLSLMMQRKAWGSKYYRFPEVDRVWVVSTVERCLPGDLAAWVEQKMFEDEDD